MKKIKVKFCNHDPRNKFSYGHFFIEILERYYDLEISEDPEYVFYNEATFDHLEYDCVRIFFTGENIYPNYNFCDYAISFEHMDFGDRFYRMPLYLLSILYQPKEIEQARTIDFRKQLSMSKAELSRKTGFCSFVYSNYLADLERKIFFDKLSEYKKVDSGGACDNNVGGRVENKLEFEMMHKFSIAFENSSRSGYTTEKIVTSLMAKTIPIYWGNPDIGREFNEKRFINCHRYENFDAVVERIRQIDNDESLYLSIVNEPVMIPTYDFEKVKAGLDIFLRNIFDQELHSARRIGLSQIRKSGMIRNEMIAARHIRRHAAVYAFLARIYQPFKKFDALERLKRKHLRKLM
ncbi:MAG: glycosyl transferase [Candidatus Taylorbacteria bacterium]|nr:glycosyl transferase [Candidatus Taylorbacteria bacterium]